MAESTPPNAASLLQIYSPPKALHSQQPRKPTVQDPGPLVCQSASSLFCLSASLPQSATVRQFSSLLIGIHLQVGQLNKIAVLSKNFVIVVKVLIRFLTLLSYLSKSFQYCSRCAKIFVSAKQVFLLRFMPKYEDFCKINSKYAEIKKAPGVLSGYIF